MTERENFLACCISTICIKSFGNFIVYNSLNPIFHQIRNVGQFKSFLFISLLRFLITWGLSICIAYIRDGETFALVNYLAIVDFVCCFEEVCDILFVDLLFLSFRFLNFATNKLEKGSECNEKR